MKFLLLVSVFISLNSFAQSVTNTRSADKAVVSRIDKVINLVDKFDIKVNVTVVDLGGSTDVSPTQKAFFTLYSKGEMFSTDATFEIGQIFSLTSARRISGGVYEVKLVDSDMKKTTLSINAVKAIKAIKTVNCGDDFDCEASAKFTSVINISKI